MSLYRYLRCMNTYRGIRGFRRVALARRTPEKAFVMKSFQMTSDPEWGRDLFIYGCFYPSNTLWSSGIHTGRATFSIFDSYDRG
jgi:hypothetical protein